MEEGRKELFEALGFDKNTKTKIKIDVSNHGEVIYPMPVLLGDFYQYSLWGCSFFPFDSLRSQLPLWHSFLFHQNMLSFLVGTVN